MKILPIGDVHVEPGQSFERLSLLGEFIVDHKPDVIVMMGDFLSLDSISSHNNHKPLLKEGKRLKDDLDAGEEAYLYMMAPIWTLQDKQRRHKEKIYKPDLYWLVGNHEDRAWRYVIENPELQGFIPDQSMLGVEDDGWKVIPYRETVYVDGIGFTHIPMAGNNQPISGARITNKAAALYDTSIVFGHVHHLECTSTAVKSAGGYHQKRALSVGCYLEEVPDYAKNSSAAGNWWSGLCLLESEVTGSFTINEYSLKQLKEMYA